MPPAAGQTSEMSPSSPAPAWRSAGPATKRRPSPSQVHQAFAPASADPHELADRQRVEELVRNPDGRTVRYRVRAVVPDGVEALRALEGAKRGRGFHEMHFGPERRLQPGGAERIGHQRAAPRPELDQPDIRRPAQPHPGIHAPEPHDLAEHLADFGRGGEIPAAPERVATGIVGGVAEHHELRKRHRPVAPDAPGQPCRQTVGHGRRTASARPMAMSGRERSCPIVTGPRMNPRCASGSRNSSAKQRASP